MLQFGSDFTENSKTFGRSFYDWVTNSGYNIYPKKADWEFNSDYEEEYNDDYIKYDLFTKIFPSSPAWYGNYAFFTKYFGGMLG